MKQDYECPALIEYGNLNLLTRSIPASEGSNQPPPTGPG